MKKQYKITPQVYKALEALAASLPKLYRGMPNGEPMMQKVAVFDGKTIFSKKQAVQVNHRVNLIEAYKTGGQTAVEIYAERVMATIKPIKDTLQAND